MTSRCINAYILGKDVFLVQMYGVLVGEGVLINRLIHRSWGESFVHIFLDLFIKID